MAFFDKKNIVKIEEDDISDAKLSSVDFKNESIKKRAFINVLGARLAIKMLFSKKIEANNVYSLYTINNVLNELDVADIYVDGIKIDVRLVFDQNEIFIPKTHFDYDILPDLYLILQLKEDFSCVEPLGFFEPSDLNKENKNTDYYFYEYENLINVKDLKTFLKNYTKKDSPEVSENDFAKAEELCLLLADNEISNSDKLFLLKQLNNSVVLREKFVEFENFEMISKETVKNEAILQDGILDIVGAQQVFEDEGANATREEVKAEVIGEVLSDLILEENTIEEVSEPVPQVKTEEDDEFLSELLESTKEEEDDDDDDERSTKESGGIGDIVTGIAIGGAIAGGISAAAAVESAINDEIIKSGIDVISSGAELAGKLIEEGLTSDKKEFENDLDEIFEEQNIEELQDQKEEAEEEHNIEIEPETQEEPEFNLDELEELFESEPPAEEPLEKEEIKEEQTTSPEEVQEEESEFNLDELEGFLDSETTTEESLEPEDGKEELAPSHEEIQESEPEFNLDELEGFLESETTTEELLSEPEVIQEQDLPIEAEAEINLDELEQEFESEIKQEPAVEQEQNEEPEPEKKFESAIEQDSQEPEIEKEINIETEPEVIEEKPENEGAIAPIPNIDELIAEGNFSFETLKEHVDEVLFEEKPNFEAYGINEEDLAKNVPDYVKDTLDSAENVEDSSKSEVLDFKEPEISQDASLETFEAPEKLIELESLGGLPELNLSAFADANEPVEHEEKFGITEEAISTVSPTLEPEIVEFEREKEEPVVKEEAKEEDISRISSEIEPEIVEIKTGKEQAKSSESVFDLDDFDFNLLSDTETIPEIEKPVIDDSFDYESIEKQIEEEEAKAKAKAEKAKNIDYEDNSIDTTDEFLAQVDDFLSQVESSEFDISGLDLSNIDLSGLESVVTTTSNTATAPPAAAAAAAPVVPNVSKEFLDSLGDEQIFDTSSLISNEDSEDQDALQLLFSGKEAKESDKEKEVIPSINKDKKMVIAASVASVVLVSLVIGGGIINNNSKMANNLTTASVVKQGQMQQPTNQIAGQNLDLSQQLPGSNISSPEQQPIPGESQQMGINKDMGEAVSDAFSSEPVNATISKIVWEIPEDLAYNDGFRSYLQMAGKNLKLNLQNNLLLATEMAYSNKVVVNVQISGSGALQSSSIATSSGSKQIDNIVLQSVKETLMYLKMPSSELRGKTVNATLIINF